MLNRETVSKAIQPVDCGQLKTRPNRRIHRTFWKQRSSWIAGLLALLSLPLNTGCQTSRFAVNEAMLVSYRDMVWAKRAYTLRYGNCERPYGEHYYNGFCAGYSEACNGGDGYVPALPPMAYRSPRFQSADGAQCVNAWFEGYPAGVAAARQEKVGNFNNVLVSKMIDTAVTNEKNAKRLLPSDVPVSSSSGSKPAVESPPNPDAVSSILVPNPELPSASPAVNHVSTADLKNPVSSVSSVKPQTLRPVDVKSQPETKLPPIVQGSGIVRMAKDSSETTQSTESQNSNRRIR